MGKERAREKVQERERERNIYLVQIVRRERQSKREGERPLPHTDSQRAPGW